MTKLFNTNAKKVDCSTQYPPNAPLSMSQPLEHHYFWGQNLAQTAYQLQDDYAYHTLPDTKLLIDDKGHLESFHIHRLQSPEKGLHAYLLVPKSGEKSASVVFSGTTDFHALARNFEYSGAGADSFEVAKGELIAQVDSWMTEYYGDDKSVHLHVAGHSLGASDAEYFATALLESKASAADETTWLDGISVYSFNSPGISYDKAQDSLAYAAKLAMCDKDFDIDVYHSKTANDGIQQLGYNHFLNGVEQDIADVYLLKHHKYGEEAIEDIALLNGAYAFAEAIIGTYHSHKLHTIFEYNENGEMLYWGENYNLYHNVDPLHAQQISDELDDKLTITVTLLSIPNFIISTTLKLIGHFLMEEIHEISNEVLKPQDIFTDHHDVPPGTNDIIDGTSVLLSCAPVSPVSPIHDDVIPHVIDDVILG